MRTWQVRCFLTFASLTALFFTWHVSNNMLTVIPPPSAQSPLVHTFSVDLNTLPALSSTVHTVYPESPHYKVFLNTGDGHFYMGENAATLPDNYQHRYTNGGSYQLYAEMTPVYDDKTDNPPSLMRTNNTGHTFSPFLLSSVPPDKVFMDNNYPIKITPVREMVPGHYLTYVVTYENMQIPNKPACSTIDGKLLFEFDERIIECTQVMEYSGGGDSLNTSVPANGQLEISIPTLSIGNQRNVFLSFITKSTVSEGAVVDPPKATLLLNDPNCTLHGSSTTLTAHTMVKSSHDPNRKTASPASVCNGNSNDYLTFRIDFQNDGAFPPNEITIEEELDYFIKNCQVENYTCTVPGAVVEKFQNGKMIKFKLSNLGKLHGLHEKGYSTLFDEEDTKGALSFRVPLNCIGSFKECSAICNRSEIVFDCNPSILTNFSITELLCLDVCGDSCLVDGIDTLPPFTVPVAGQVLVTTALKAALQGYQHFKWYPTTGLNNANASLGASNLDVTLAETKTRTYVLVATSGCQRRIVYFPVVSPCSMSLVNVEAIPTGDFIGSCPAVPTYTLSAEVAGTGFSIKDIIWHDCQIGISHWSSMNTGNPNAKIVGPGTYFISVKDPVSGCSVEQWVSTPPLPQPLVVDDKSGDCMAEINVSGGTSPYIYTWEWNDQPQTFTGQSVSLNGKNNVGVTVTDAKKCKAYVYPKKGKCGWWDNLGFGTLAIIGLVILVAGTGLYFLLKKQ